MDLCLEVDHMMVPRVTKWWWDKDGFDVEGMWKAAWEAEQMEGEEETDGTET